MTPTANPIDDWLPLREPTFWILVSLASGKKHGYAILREVEGLSDQRVLLSTGTLYEALARLLEQNLIERIEGEEDPALENGARAAHRGKPRKAYRLTTLGRRVLQAEMARLQAMAAVAGQHLQEGLLYE